MNYKKQTEVSRQRQLHIIREFISQHRPGIGDFLRDTGLLNANNKIPRNQGIRKQLIEWFLTAISSSDYWFNIDDAYQQYSGHIKSPILNLEINKFDSATDNPVLFCFPVRHFPVLLPECIWATVISDLTDETWWNKHERKEPTIQLSICGESRQETYCTLFVDRHFGALRDIPGFSSKYEIGAAINTAINKCEEELCKAVSIFAEKTLQNKDPEKLKSIGTALLNKRKLSDQDRKFLGTTLINISAGFITEEKINDHL